MEILNEQQCEACVKGAPELSGEEIATFLNGSASWKLIEDVGVKKIAKEYVFKNFVEALSFTNVIATESEKQNHHPDILTQWGKVTLTWWTHKIQGLHKNDIIMARKSDVIYENQKYLG